MSVQIRGNGGTIAEVEANTRALRVTQRPDDIGALGAFALSGFSGTMAAGITDNSEIFQFRWTHSTNLAKINRIQIWAGGIAAFTAGVFRFDVVMARSWTADGSGGTAATMTGNNAKKRTSSATSLVGSVRLSTTAALGAGTKTLDVVGVGSVGGSVLASAGDKLVAPVADLFRCDGTNYPIVLAQNEGFVIRAAVPATGTWTFGVNCEWSEQTSY